MGCTVSKGDVLDINIKKIDNLYYICAGDTLYCKTYKHLDDALYIISYVKKHPDRIWKQLKVSDYE
jgi:hypothetical protein